MSARQRILKNRVADEDEKDIGEDGDDEPKEGKRKRKRKSREVEKAVREQLMEEYYKLDYEDTIGDLKTRFKYKTVKAKRYGLTPEEVLRMDDKDLNQYVSLKKLAPYREKEWKVPRIKTIQLKQQSKKSHNGIPPFPLIKIGRRYEVMVRQQVKWLMQWRQRNQTFHNQMATQAIYPDGVREDAVKLSSSYLVLGLWLMGKSLPNLKFTPLAILEGCHLAALVSVAQDCTADSHQISTEKRWFMVSTDMLEACG
ncbi:UNVERIFIED_CONTAM: protein KRI1 [Sesamum calycinum]|uniref:Protein KRI1 n=1 Tax=Sesamum calycinum TaxID=2727403 RepID=A0AAW2P9R3_9LAMI